MASQQRIPRKTGWKKADKRLSGIYRSKLASGWRWGYFDKQLGRVVQVQGGKQAAMEAKAKADLRKQAGTPAPDSQSKLIRELGEEVREAKRRRNLARFKDWERMLDLYIEELGHLKPAQAGADRCARLIRDLEDGTITGNPLVASSIRKNLAPLNAIFKLALRRGLISVNPLTLLDDDERAAMNGGGVRDHYEWSTQQISDLIAASVRLARRPAARYDYSPLIRVLIFLGLRVGEALGLRVRDVDLLEGVLHVRHNRRRDGSLSETKTEAGVRDVPLSPGMVDLFVSLIPADADPDDYVFHTRRSSKRPISYWNFRGRGFLPALTEAGLDGKGITIHGLRSAAVSIYASSGLTLAETADVMGQADPLVTWKHYLKLFDRTKVNERIRAAQESIELGEAMGGSA
jgi:integrase